MSHVTVGANLHFMRKAYSGYLMLRANLGEVIPSMESVSNIAVCLVKIVSPTITNFICGIVVTYTLQGKCSLF